MVISGAEQQLDNSRGSRRRKGREGVTAQGETNRRRRRRTGPPWPNLNPAPSLHTLLLHHRLLLLSAEEGGGRARPGRKQAHIWCAWRKRRNSFLLTHAGARGGRGCGERKKRKKERRGIGRQRTNLWLLLSSPLLSCVLIRGYFTQTTWLSLVRD